MKNIHLLPTEKPSRLGYLTKKGKEVFKDLRLFDTLMPQILDSENQNIHITNDEEIKDGDFWLYICPINGLDYGYNGNPIVKNNLPNSWFEKLHDKNNYKKIILTTDQDLIKDGVQAIYDEFLEWFVKNPSCECVEFEKMFNVVQFTTREYIYKIIIPKEEPNQETLEEVAERILLGEDLDLSDYDKRHILKAMVNIAKWQEEQTIEEAFEWLTTQDYLTDLKETLIENFKEFKNK